MAPPLTEDHFFTLMAERPDDRSLRLVFSDWLQEQGDPRGEAIALWEQAEGRPTATVRRKLKRLQEKYGRAWLGPALASLAAVPNTGWDGGLASSLVVHRELAPQRWAALVGEPRLSTVRKLEFSPFLRWPPPGFFAHPVLRGLTVLRAPLHLLAPLAGVKLPFSLRALGLTALGRFEGELAALTTVDALFPVARLELKTLEMVNGGTAAELRRSVREQRRALSRFQTVELDLAHGTFEGVAGWLALGSERQWFEETWAGEAWGARQGGVAFSLERTRTGAWARLRIDLDGEEGLEGIEGRLAATASVLVLLDELRLEAVELSLPAGGRLRPSERSALRAALRRLKSVETFRVDGAPVEP